MNKKTDPAVVRDVSIQICPDLATVISHDSPITASTWTAGIETGKSVEVLALCALVAAFRSSGHEVSFPRLYTANPDLFYLRNEIPRHHGAQAGHDAVIATKLPLFDRFLAALTPKAMAKTKDGRCFLIYREGHPFHLMRALIKNGVEYLDRPDLLIAEGKLDLDVQNSRELPFVYKHPTGCLQGSLRIKNDIKMPLISLESSGSPDISINGIIECSVGKGRERAEDQLGKYLQLCSGPARPISALINGRKKSCPAYDHEIYIDLAATDATALAQQLTVGLSKLVLDLR